MPLETLNYQSPPEDSQPLADLLPAVGFICFVLTTNLAFVHLARQQPREVALFMTIFLGLSINLLILLLSLSYAVIFKLMSPGWPSTLLIIACILSPIFAVIFDFAFIFSH